MTSHYTYSDQKLLFTLPPVKTGGIPKQLCQRLAFLNANSRCFPAKTHESSASALCSISACQKGAEDILNIRTRACLWQWLLLMSCDVQAASDIHKKLVIRPTNPKNAKRHRTSTTKHWRAHGIPHCLATAVDLKTWCIEMLFGQESQTKIKIKIERASSETLEEMNG